MKKIISTILLIGSLANVSVLRAENVGVPSECEDVMLQAFYWDSYKTQTSTDSKYGRTKWIDLLKDTAAINANFDVVWFPPSAGPTGCGVGYSAKEYSKQDSDWGTKVKLNQLIAALHAGNTKVLADVVLNHRGSATTWCSFSSDNFGSNGNWQLTQKHIVSNDECFTNKSSSCYNAVSSERGAYDTGDNFDGARDLDHTSEYVQEWSKAYTQWLLNTMNYDGFRYDMTLGFHGSYLKMYNEAANPYISVSELWSGIDRQKQHLEECGYNTMVFDFQTKYSLHGIVSGSYGKLNANKSYEGFRKHGLARYAVTFIDNHDTFDRDNAYGDNQFGNGKLSNATTKNQILQASTYILMMPGIPCVFYPHWASYKEEINALIALRKQAGIHSESEVISEESGPSKYEATVQGHHGRVVFRLGKNRSPEVPDGYYMAVNGNDYTVFMELGTGIEEVKGEQRTRGEKFLKDGQLLIRVHDEIYTILGEKIQ